MDFTAPELVDTLYRGLADNSVGKVIDQLLRPDLVIVDEIGFAPLDDAGAQLLFRLVSAAYERVPLGIASHWPFDQWGRFPVRLPLCCSGRPIGSRKTRFVHTSDSCETTRPCDPCEGRAAGSGDSNPCLAPPRSLRHPAGLRRPPAAPVSNVAWLSDIPPRSSFDLASCLSLDQGRSTGLHQCCPVHQLGGLPGRVPLYSARDRVRRCPS